MRKRNNDNVDDDDDVSESLENKNNFIRTFVHCTTLPTLLYILHDLFNRLLSQITVGS